MNYVIGVSEAKQMPLVLETSTVWNRVQYEKYGFRVVDRVEGRPDLGANGAISGPPIQCTE